MEGIIHLHQRQVESDLKILFLAIPIIIFVLIAIVLLTSGPKPEVVSAIATP